MTTSNQPTWTATEVAQAILVNQLLAGGMAEAAVGVAAADSAEALDVLRSMPGCEVGDSGYGEAQIDFLEQGVRIFTNLGTLMVWVQDTSGRWDHKVWDQAARVEARYIPLGAAVEIIEAILTSRA